MQPTDTTPSAFSPPSDLVDQLEKLNDEAAEADALTNTNVEPSANVITPPDDIVATLDQRSEELQEEVQDNTIAPPAEVVEVLEKQVKEAEAQEAEPTGTEVAPDVIKSIE